MHLIPCSVLAAVAAALPAQSRWFVDGAVPSPGDGRSWVAAFRTVQQGLAAAGADDEVWVAAGTYAGGFTVPDAVRLLGGFRPGDARPTQRAPAANITVLDGEDRQRVLTLDGRCSVDGFVVLRGSAPSPGGGGAMVTSGGAPSVTRCWFVANRNRDGRGSAMVVYNAAPHVADCVFTRSAGAGHVIDLNTAGGTYRNLVIADNESNGLHFQAGSTPRIESCAFVGNTGFGLCHIDAADVPTLRNCLLLGNRNGHILVPGQGALRTIEAVNALPYARDNISAEPRFVNPAAADYRIAADSPMVDAGLDDPTSDRLDDLAGGPRVLDGDLDGRARVDIGAFEVGHVALLLPREASRGTTLPVALPGRPGLAAVLLLGTQPGVLRVPPFGDLRLSPAAPFVVLPVGLVPVQTSLAVPASLPLGLALHWQGVGATATGGNFTAPADVTVR